MMRLTRACGVLLSLSLLNAVPADVSAQAPDFEVASIRPSAEQVQQASIGIHITGSQVRISYFTLKDYIGMAYDLPPGQIAGPGWLTDSRFDISAKIPDGVPSSEVPAMLQKLLASRFELKVHHDSREFSVYALTVTKGGLRAKESPLDPNLPDNPNVVNVAGSGNASGVTVDLGAGSYFSLANNRLEIKKATMASVALSLTRLMDRQVIDATGVSGRYDFTMELTPDDYGAILIRSAVNAGVQLPPQALRMLDLAPSDPFSGPLDKFGLTLESRKSPLDVVVVDSMRKTPTEN